MVKVQLFAYFREAVNQNELKIDAENVAELIDNLTSEYRTLAPLIYESQESKLLNSDVMILVNGRNIEALQGLKTELKSTDIISIFPPICGG